jgi:hypothetical protein
MIRKEIFFSLVILSLLANIFFVYANFTKRLSSKDQEGDIIENMISKCRYEYFAESCSVKQYEECTEAN